MGVSESGVGQGSSTRCGASGSKELWFVAVCECLRNFHHGCERTAAVKRSLVLCWSLFAPLTSRGRVMRGAVECSWFCVGCFSRRSIAELCSSEAGSIDDEAISISLTVAF